jgi:hypothetical protein
MYDYNLIILRECVAKRSEMLKSRAAAATLKNVKTYKFL